MRHLYDALNSVTGNNLYNRPVDYRFPMITSEKPVFEGPLQQLARSTWQLLLLVGVTAVALGVVVLAWPGKTLFVAGVLFGASLLKAMIPLMPKQLPRWVSFQFDARFALFCIAITA